MFDVPQRLTTGLWRRRRRFRVAFLKAHFTLLPSTSLQFAHGPTVISVISTLTSIPGSRALLPVWVWFLTLPAIELLFWAVLSGFGRFGRNGPQWSPMISPPITLGSGGNVESLVRLFI